MATLVKRENCLVAIERGRFRDIVCRDGAIRPAQENIRRNLAANHRDLRRQVNPQHGQHTSPPSNSTLPSPNPSSPKTSSTSDPDLVSTTLIPDRRRRRRSGSAITRP
ncbi:hypothetical protein C4D60_Mb06t30500 [Musa balbisiana]|uniref:Uncharacterized protein n=1 Tax=Musa balbisiana TaxID=52838 RepID=A0A4S8IRT4_MUSBA|nr:hypothetical protein C4D60_Mb06t30500 [Musa balbisiana]